MLCMGLIVCLSEILNNHFIVVIIVLSYIVVGEFIQPINWSNMLNKKSVSFPFRFFWLKKKKDEEKMNQRKFCKHTTTVLLHYGTESLAHFFRSDYLLNMSYQNSVHLLHPPICCSIFIHAFIVILISVKLWINAIIWGQKTYLLYKPAHIHTWFSYEHMNYGCLYVEQTEWRKKNV